jgi:hypothetical protein
MRALANETLSELEIAILQKAASRVGSPELLRQSRAANLKNREFTGVGVFVNLDLKDRRIEDARPDIRNPIDGLIIASDALPLGSADSLVWLDDEGYLSLIEIVGNGGYPDSDYEAQSPEITEQDVPSNA